MSAETARPIPILQRSKKFLQTLELPGELLLFLYFLVFARQYLWWLTENNAIAWSASLIIAALAGYFYFSTKEVLENETTPLPFWLVVVLPLVLIFAARVVFPDVSFDVLNYRLVHAERSLSGFLYRPGDFFPTPAPYNPAPDMVTGLFRHALGYRLGTIPNLLAMIWAARIADKLLRPFFRNAWLRAAAVLLAMMSEHLLFEINNYMADLLALPLLLEATYLALKQTDVKKQRRNLVCIALLLGMSVAFKLTNAAVALPVVLLCAYRALATRSEGNNAVRKATALGLTTIYCALAFVVALVPFSAYLYRETGSIVFPVFNGIFKSPYWPLNNVWDPRWGPKGLSEKLLWPLLITFHPERLSELSVYSGRISFGFAVALLGLITLLLLRRDRRLLEICFLVVASVWLWTASTGYIRYAFYIEVMAAVAVLGLAAQLVELKRNAIAIGLASVLFLALFVQGCLAVYFVSQTEWGGRRTFLTSPRAYRHEVRYLFRDRSLRDFMNQGSLSRIDNVQVWIVSSIKTAGIEVLLRRDVPMIGVMQGEFFASNEGLALFDRALDLADGKRMFSLVFMEDFEAAKANLERHGLRIMERKPIEIPFYSRNVRINAFLLEVERNKTDQLLSLDHSALTPVVPLASGAYRAQILVRQQAPVMKAGTKQLLEIKVKNMGSARWPARVSQGWMNTVTLGDRWLTADGSVVVNDMDSRAVLGRDLQPGEEADLSLSVTPPATPGTYLLELDMVHEGVTWFYQQGSPTLRWQVKVEK